MRNLNTSGLVSIVSGTLLSLVLSVGAAAQSTPASTDSQSQSAPSTQAAPSAAPSQSSPSQSSPSQAPSAGPDAQTGASSSGAHASAPPQQGNAQQGGGASSIDDELQLTPDQKQKIAAVVDDENKQIATVRDDNSMTLEQKQQKALQIRQAGTPKIKAILTPDQLQKLAAIQQRMREQQQGTSGQQPPQNSAPSTAPNPQH
jgi:predicted transglutaminase-like cysteine proteinase